MKLNFVSLSYFQKVAELQHMTEAAKELHIAQPSLSRTIRELEKELDVSLFYHQGRNIRLTKEGKILLKYTRNFHDGLKNLQKELDNSKNIRQMTVDISILSASELIPVFLMKFKQEHPDALLEIIRQEGIGLTDKKVDLSIFSSADPIDNDHTITLLREDLMLAIPYTDPHAHLPHIELKDFSEYNFIAPPKGMVLRSTIEGFCQSVGFTPKIVMESDNPHTVREFIAAGLGVAIVPKITWHGVKDEHVSLLTIYDPDCHRYLSLSWRTDSKLSLTAILLREYIVDHFGEFVKKSVRE